MDGRHGLYLERDSQSPGTQPSRREAQRHVFAISRRACDREQRGAGDSSGERLVGVQCDVSERYRSGAGEDSAVTSIQKTHWVAVLISLLLLGVPPRLATSGETKIIDGAKKEGELAWWSTIAQDQSQKIIEEFMKRYPFIKANYWRSGSVGLHNKIMIEARAGRSSWDVVSQTTPEF